MIAVSKKRLWALRLMLLVGAGFCLYLAVNFWDSMMRYAIEVSSNPHPSEKAKLLAPQLWYSTKLWLVPSLIFLLSFTFTFFLKSTGVKPKGEFQIQEESINQEKFKDVSKSE